MSIRPEFALAILRGEKRVEFRKNRLRDEAKLVLIYATQPVGAIIGAFSVVGQVTDHPHILWHRFSSQSGLEHCSFNSYYTNHRQGTGIQIGETFVFNRRISLAESFGLSRPPQSYQYVDLERALNLLNDVARDSDV